MKFFSWLILVVLLLTGACKEEDFFPANKETEVQKIKKASTATSDGCKTDTLKTGEIIQICKPDNWNGELILFAHGYVPDFAPLTLPAEANFFIPVYVSQGYAFATTSYSENGLAVQSGIANMLDLRNRFIKDFGEPKYTFLVGGSLGGIIATLAIERNPGLFSGVLSMSAPIGDFQKRINYFGDFRALFDYFFPGVLPGSAVNIPDYLLRDLGPVYIPAILQAIRQNPNAGLKLLHISRAPYDPANASTIEQTFLELLLRNILFTRGEREKFGGQPYYNWNKFYKSTGSIKGDLKVNALIDRFIADKRALQNVEQYYQTSGNISAPLVNMYTTMDPAVVWQQAALFEAKVMAQGKGDLYTGIPIERYGHYNFTPAEIVNGFTQLVSKVKGKNTKPSAAALLPSYPGGNASAGPLGIDINR